jgi:hypothetical protein
MPQAEKTHCTLGSPRVFSLVGVQLNFVLVLSETVLVFVIERGTIQSSRSTSTGLGRQ